MNLIYVWNEDYLNKEKYRQAGFCLSSKYDVKYDINEMELSIIKNHSYVPNFWGENIFDVMAVVGDNGSGKTKETRTWLQELGVSTNIIEKDGDITIKIY